MTTIDSSSNSFRLRKFITTLASICALLVHWGAAARAAETLPENELKEGWISLFDGKTLFGWTRLGDADWKVQDGAIVCESGTGGWLASTSQFADFEMTLQIRVSTIKEVSARGTVGPTSGIVLRGGLEGHHTGNGSGHILIVKPPKAPVWQDVKVKAQGGGFTAIVNGTPIVEHPLARGRGYIGFQFHPALLCKVEIRDVKLRPLGAGPIFNGKDLKGWSILPGHIAKIGVVDGSINIRGGEGSIETTGVYNDFMLRMEIFTNGDHLNSGVYFRATPGLFWSGYETQICNKWQGNDRTKPIDAGTGGIYGVQSAREVVSSDREWFYLTILCDGNHYANWVNGYLDCDLLDTRPIGPYFNGKSGYEPGPGSISLQGHDPEGDISFRNIAIAAYPEK